MTFGTRKRRRMREKDPPKATIPWWRQPPRKSGVAGRTDGTRTGEGACEYCSQDVHIACERCDRDLCIDCCRCCDVCENMWCKYCTIVDYESAYERSICVECYDGVDAVGSDEGKGETLDRVTLLDSEGDDSMDCEQ